MTGLDVKSVLERLLHFWWVLVLGALVGCLVGWVFPRIQPTIYEATAYYEVDVNEQALLARLGRPQEDELDFASVNPYLLPVEDAFYDPGIRSQVLSALDAQEIRITQEEFTTRTFILDRRGFIWFVTARDKDPERAVRMADIWLQTVDESLRHFQTHAVTAQALQAEVALVERCFDSGSLEEANRCAGTALGSAEELEPYLSGLTGRAEAERLEAKGIDPLVSFRIERQAEATLTPMLYDRAILLLAGSGLGFLLSLLFVLLHRRFGSAVEKA